MREIKFRGINNGRWVYGSLFERAISEEFYIAFENTARSITELQVSPESVGQYTGLKDKNGKEIYDGDILEYKRSKRFLRDIVIFSEGAFWCGYHDGGSTRKKIKLIQSSRVEVIGNINENPELLNA